MKLLKYVMTSDAGLAPNPFFEICSLAVCTPNHRRARLEVGDWVVGHSCKRTGNKLIYAMCVTSILTMPEYYEQFPLKRPNRFGDRNQQCGDNFYYIKTGQWRRLPSIFHNNQQAFTKDIDRPVFLAEGHENYWYFGGSDDRVVSEFPDLFPDLIKDRQGISYVRDGSRIEEFVAWLHQYSRSGEIGSPRDRVDTQPDRFLVQIEPQPRWISAEDTSDTSSASGESCSNNSCRPSKPESKRMPNNRGSCRP
jgi:hypothetical protein